MMIVAAPRVVLAALVWSLVAGSPPSLRAAHVPPLPVTDVPDVGEFDQVVRPAVASPWVAVLGRGADRQVTVQRWSLQQPPTKKGEIVVDEGFLPQSRLGPDGQLFARTSNKPQHTVQVWSFEPAKLVATIPAERAAGEPKLLGFASPTHLVIQRSTRGKWAMEIWDAARGAKLREVPLADDVRPTEVAFSPTGKSLAIAPRVRGPRGEKRSVLVYDVATGAQQREFLLAAGDEARDQEVMGMAFSPDGKELAVLTDPMHKRGARLRCFSLADGKTAADFAFPEGLRHTFSNGFVSDKSSGLEYLGADYLVAYDRGLVDRKSGRALRALTVEDAEYDGANGPVDATTLLDRPTVSGRFSQPRQAAFAMILPMSRPRRTTAVGLACRSLDRRAYNRPRSTSPPTTPLSTGSSVQAASARWAVPHPAPPRPVAEIAGNRTDGAENCFLTPSRRPPAAPAEEVRRGRCRCREDAAGRRRLLPPPTAVTGPRKGSRPPSGASVVTGKHASGATATGTDRVMAGLSLPGGGKLVGLAAKGAGKILGKAGTWASKLWKGRKVCNFDNARIVASALDTEGGMVARMVRKLQERATSAKSGRPDLWGPLPNKAAEKLAKAQQHLDEILSGPSTWVDRTATTGPMGPHFEKFLPDGRGVAVSPAGDFITFVHQ